MPLLLGVVALHQGGDHAHRRAARRGVRDQLRIELLQEIDPPRRAGGDHRQRAVRQPREKLVGFLDDRQIGAEIGVEDGVEPQPPQGGDHLAGGRGAGGKSKALADGGADRRGRLHHHVHLGVGQGGPDAAGAALLEEGRRGADVDALPALDAHRVVHVGQVGGGHDGVEAAALLAEVVDPLDLGAHPHAAPAEHAFLAVADDAMAGKVQGEPLPLALEVPRPHAQRVGQVLQLAVAVALAGLAVLGVVVQEQLDDVAAGLADVGGIGLHVHALPHLLAAGGHVEAHVLDLDHAHAAGAHEAQVAVVAEAGNADAQFLARLHDGRPLGDGHGSAVDGERNLLLTHERLPRPGGTFDSSPAIHRWGNGRPKLSGSPVGTIEIGAFGRPSGTCRLRFLRPHSQQ